MRKLSLSEWASAAEITGAFAVVISLIFLIVSIDKNTATITAQVEDASYAAVREVNLQLLNNPELFDITVRAATSLDDLNDAELEKYKIWIYINLDLWERFYSWDRSGLIDQNAAGWHDYFSAWTTRHVTRELWHEIKWKFRDPDFNEQVESALSEQLLEFLWRAAARGRLRADVHPELKQFCATNDGQAASIPIENELIAALASIQERTASKLRAVIDQERGVPGVSLTSGSSLLRLLSASFFWLAPRNDDR